MSDSRFASSQDEQDSDSGTEPRAWNFVGVALRTVSPDLTVTVLSADPAPIASDDLAAKLRREAGRVTSDFSAELHEKIMRSVAVAHAYSSHTEPSRVRILSAALLAGAIAAMAMLATLGATLHMLRLRDSTAPQFTMRFVSQNRGKSAASPPAALFHEAAREVNVRVENAVEVALERQQFAGLDHDVQLAAQYLVDRAPFRSAWESPGSDSADK